MAVNRVPQTSRMVITVQNGVSAGGQPVYLKRTYKNLKPGAVDADVYAVAGAMASLQKYPLTGIARSDDGNLVNV